MLAAIRARTSRTFLSERVYRAILATGARHFPRHYSLSSSSQDPFDAPQKQRAGAHCAPFPKRTHNCGANLNAADAGSRVILTGWLLPERKGKLVSFFPLKDAFGTIQLIVNHSERSDHLDGLSKVPVESVVLIEGTVVVRPDGARRPGPRGDIDVQVDRFILLNPAATELPFVPSDTRNLANDDIRARYRYLDLRRTALSDNLRKRSQVAHIVRNVLYDQGFLEVETPVLLRSSPEGAREFLVPTRTSTSSTNSGGKITEEPLFYALPQSPQQPKQLLICSGGVDKYFQLAKCFRDEDGRKDRQPEFTQIDLEMAFVSWGDPKNASSPDHPSSHPSSRSNSWRNSHSWRIGGGEVRDVVETLVRTIWHQVEGAELPPKFKVMTYHEAMTRFGSDKPDTRFGLEILDITHLLPPDQRLALENREEVFECIVVRQSRDHRFIRASQACRGDTSVEHITLTTENAPFWMHKNLTLDNEESISSNTAQTSPFNEALSLSPGDDIWLSTRSKIPSGGSTSLGRLRLRLSELAQARGDLTLSDAPHFLWITEFPLFTRSDEDKEFLAHGRWSSSHHPFTAPMWQDIERMYNGRIEAVRGQHYDLVLNGVEIGGGSVRVHDAAMQDFIFSKILQLTDSEKAPFEHLLHALKCGAPPHGGLALGFDRLMAILCKTQSIRDVIAFPKTSTGKDLLFESPAEVSKDVLYQYGIQPR